MDWHFCGLLKILKITHSNFFTIKLYYLRLNKMKSYNDRENFNLYNQQFVSLKNNLRRIIITSKIPGKSSRK